MKHFKQTLRTTIDVSVVKIAEITVGQVAVDGEIIDYDYDETNVDRDDAAKVGCERFSSVLLFCCCSSCL